eukprot:COSAG06_NODE_478_length_15216_cov_101.587286_8_plen_91_part_00
MFTCPEAKDRGRPGYVRSERAGFSSQGGGRARFEPRGVRAGRSALGGRETWTRGKTVLIIGNPSRIRNVGTGTDLRGEYLSFCVVVKLRV